MCIFGGSQPSVPSVSTSVTPTPQQPDNGSQTAASDQRKRATAAVGAGATVLTSGQGDTSTANTTGKTLLGA